MHKLIQEINAARQIKKSERKAAFRAIACSDAKSAKVMRIVMAKAKAVEARKTGQVKEKLDHIIFFLCMQTQMMLHDIG